MAGESRATGYVDLVELQGDGLRATEMVVITEIGGLGLYATSMIVIVELTPIYKPKGHYFWNGIDITPYCNQLQLQSLIDEVDSTRLNDTAAAKKPKLGTNSIELAGDWSPTLDAILGPDAMTGVKRTGVATFEDGVSQTSYTWANQAALRNWKVTTHAMGKIEWSATIRHNGAGVRAESSL